MLSEERARKVAQEALEVIKQLPGNEQLDIVIYETRIVESPEAWIFPFNSREYVTTGNVRSMLIGVGPVVVNKLNGKAFVAPPLPMDKLIEQYKANAGEGYNWF